MKDNFSQQSAEYSKFRPHYPSELIEFIVSLVDNRECALDVATGNGQIAHQLAPYFRHVEATDISDNQLKNAVLANNVVYSKQPAEATSFTNKAFDLIVVAQAIHWFDFAKFYAEVYRLLKNDGIFAVIGYGNYKVNAHSQRITDRFYYDIVGPYWDPERKYLDAEYKTIPFPLKEVAVPEFSINLEWTFDQLVGYLSTWSAVQHFKQKNNADPIALIYEELRESWNQSDKKITFPILLRVGKLNN